MCTICRLSARCLPLELSTEMLLCFCDLAGYHPLKACRARSAVRSLASLVLLAPDDDTPDNKAFPVGRRDANTDLGQQPP